MVFCFLGLVRRGGVVGGGCRGCREKIDFFFRIFWGGFW